MEREIERRNATLRLGVGSQRGRGYQTRQSLLLSDPPSEHAFVYVCVCARLSPPPQPDNREGPVPDWGQLVAAEGRGGGGRGERGWVVGIRHHCLD